MHHHIHAWTLHLCMQIGSPVCMRGSPSPLVSACPLRPFCLGRAPRAAAQTEQRDRAQQLLHFWLYAIVFARDPSRYTHALLATYSTTQSEGTGSRCAWFAGNTGLRNDTQFGGARRCQESLPDRELRLPRARLHEFDRVGIFGAFAAGSGVRVCLLPWHAWRRTNRRRKNEKRRNSEFVGNSWERLVGCVHADLGMHTLHSSVRITAVAVPKCTFPCH